MGDGFLQRLKPRASARVQLVLAGTLWFIAAAILGSRGALWLAEEPGWLWMAAVALVAGLVKARYLLGPVARRAAARIVARGRDRCAGGFLSWQSWLLVLAMVAGGHALRLTATPRWVLAMLYVAVATALLVGGSIYWRGVAGSSGPAET